MSDQNMDEKEFKIVTDDLYLARWHSQIPNLSSSGILGTEADYFL